MLTFLGSIFRWNSVRDARQTGQAFRRVSGVGETLLNACEVGNRSLFAMHDRGHRVAPAAAPYETDRGPVRRQDCDVVPASMYLCGFFFTDFKGIVTYS